MMARVARLIRAEFLKIFGHPFVYVALAVVAAASIGGACLGPGFRAQKETVWRHFNSIQLFAYGFDYGLTFATYVLVIFSSMMFAGEFDRGTIKNLLACPVTRLDLFIAKGLSTVALSVILFVFVLYVSLAYALARGDLGPVWDTDYYLVQREYGFIAAFARKAVLICFLPFLAAGFMGLLVSNWTESSGYAVAMGLILFLLAELATRMMTRGREFLFLHYAPYTLEMLKRFAEGGGEMWRSELDEKLLYVKVPLLYMAAFIPPAYGIFRARNIHV